MRALTLLTVVVAVGLALPIPPAGTTPPEAVEFGTVEQLALRKAQAEWPGCRPGPVLPLLDPDGATVAYAFHFRTDGKEFPDFEQVASDIRAERANLTANADLSQWTSEYATVLVSARYDRAPVLSYGYGVSAFYAVGQDALDRAVERLGPGARLSRMYFVFPQMVFEFTNAAQERFVTTPHFDRSWESRADFAGDLARRRAELEGEYGHDAARTAEVHRAEWSQALGRDFTDYTDVFVPDYDRAPYYDWSYGCTPTSGAMVCGFLDRRDDFGLLVDWYWHRWDMVENEMDWQIPNVQRECALEMHTDTTSGGTGIGWVGTGLRRVIEGNGYSCWMVDVQGGVGNDWAWSTITAEVDDGFCFVWSALWEIHSLACFGYRTPDKDVYVHNTWWQPAAWWHYSGDDWSHVASPHASDGDAHKVVVSYPLGDTAYSSIGGGEILQVGDTIDITWDNGGNPGDGIEIDISTNGGRQWSSLATDAPDNGSFEWYLDPSTSACDSMRLRLRQYVGGYHVSGDGSFGCFRIIREPVPPMQVAPPNGRQVFDPPIVLEIEPFAARVDSIEFALLTSTDTLWKEKGVVTVCSLPDTLFTYGRSYKWVVRAHNEYGWGRFSTFWSFWVRFQGVEESGTATPVRELAVAGVNSLAEGVVFELGRSAPGARLVVYDALGQVAARLEPGRALSVRWNGRDAAGRQVAAGLYFVRLERDGATVTRRFLLVD